MALKTVLAATRLCEQSGGLESFWQLNLEGASVLQLFGGVSTDTFF
jgi:hypothetical protein